MMKLNVDKTKNPDISLPVPEVSTARVEVVEIKKTITSEGWQYLIDEWNERERKLFEEILEEENENKIKENIGRIKEGRFRIRGLIDSIIGGGRGQ